MRMIFRKFLVSYMAMLLIPMLMGAYVYALAMRKLEDAIEKNNLSVLKRSSDTIDSYLLQIDRLSGQISYNSRLGAFLRLGDPLLPGSDYTILDAYKDLTATGILNNSISYYYIHAKGSDVTLTPTTAYYDSRLFYANCLNYPDMTYEEWYGQLHGSYRYQDVLPVSRVTLQGQETLAMTYVQSLPISGNHEQFQGTAAFLIDESVLRRTFENLQIGERGWYCIVDQDGGLLYSSRGDAAGSVADDVDLLALAPGQTHNVPIGGRNLILTVIASEAYGWKYVAAIPRETVYVELEYIRHAILLFTGALLLLGILISVFLAHFNSRPIRRLSVKLASTLHGTVSPKGELSTLETGLDFLLDRNQSLQQVIDEQLPMLRAGFFYRLISGDFGTADRASAAAAHAKIDLNGSLYILLLFGIKIHRDASDPYEVPLPLMEGYRAVLHGVLEKRLRFNGYIYNIDNDKTMVLLSFTHEDPSILLGNIDAYVTEVEERVAEDAIPLCVGISNLYTGLNDTYRAYNQALAALLSRSGERRWYRGLPRDERICYYPLEVESHLMNLTAVGNGAEAKTLLNELYRENFVKRRLALSMREMLLQELRGTFFKLAARLIAVDEEAEHQITSMEVVLQSGLKPEEAFAGLTDCFLSLCQAVCSGKKTNAQDLRERMLTYLEQNYTDPQVSLTAMATCFSMNEAYLSVRFKEQTGECFSAFLERTRIAHACEVLTGDEQTIASIGLMVGYHSDQSFRRAFKRATGLSPSEYRFAHRDSRVPGA